MFWSIIAVATTRQVVRLLLASGADRTLLSVSGKSPAAVANTRDIARLLAVDQVSGKTHPATAPNAASSAKSAAAGTGRGPGAGKQTEDPEGTATTPSRLMDYFVLLKQTHAPGADEGRQVRLHTVLIIYQQKCAPTRSKARFVTR